METLDSIVGSIFVVVAAVVINLMYDHRDKKYSRDKKRMVASGNVFRLVDPYLRVSTFLFTVSALWISNDMPLRLYHHALPLYLGVVLATLGLSVFISAKLTLGKSYSPCYDSYLPRKLISSGIYRFVRHPIYVGNISLIVGFFVMTGFLPILFNGMVLFYFYRQAAIHEESALLKEFSEYLGYFKSSGRFFPKLSKLLEASRSLVVREN